MPSRLKELMVKEAVERYRDVQSMVAVAYERISAEDATALRQGLRKRNVDLRVVRNSVVQRAFEELGRGDFGKLLTGPVAVIAAEDVVEASKAADELAKERHLELRGGWAEGRDLTQEEVAQLAKLPGRKALLAQIAGMAAAPLRSLVGMIGAPGAALARALRAWNDKRGEAPGQEPGAEGAQ
ncbi:MAG: 50S ribosomal protein L10 [Planctomycetota bacterium]